MPYGYARGETLDDAPTWLIHDEPDGGVAWHRVSDDGNPGDLVDARLWAGGHTNAAEVLNWLRDGAPDPWGGMGGGDAVVHDELRQRIRLE